MSIYIPLSRYNFYETLFTQHLITGAGGGATWSDVTFSEVAASSIALCFMYHPAGGANLGLRTNGSALVRIITGVGAGIVHPVAVLVDSSKIAEAYINAAGTDYYIFCYGYLI